jgi:flagellar biosynthesis chaperone FliJ
LSNLHNNYEEKLENSQKKTEELKNVEILYENKSSEFELMENN